MRSAELPARILAWTVVGAACLAPPALVAACVVDVGPSGAPRVSLFPLALVVWSPLTWACVRNSVAAGLIVAGLSAGIGSRLAELTGPWRYWGRVPLRAVAMVPLAVGPFLGTLGLRLVADAARLSEVLEAWTGVAAPAGVSWEDVVGWLVLIGGNTLWGTMVVAAAAESALARVDPRWVEAGRSLGASPKRARRELVRPNLRPGILGAAASVFAAFLLEPGGPIAARLPRTLGFQVADAAIRAFDVPRASILVVIGILIGLGARFVVRRRTGPPPPIPPDEPAPPPTAGWARAGGSLAVLAAWSVVGLLPLAGFVRTLAGEGTTDERLTHVFSMVYYGLLDRGAGRALAVSALLGLTAAAANGFAVAVLASRGGRTLAAVVRLPGAVPAAGFGVGAIAAALFLEHGAGIGGLDPIRNPGPLLLLATMGAGLASLARPAITARRRSRPELVEAALAFGASKRRARRLAGGPGVGVSEFLAAAVLAATELSPALFLAPASDVRPVGPILLDLLEDPRKAAGLALAVVAARLILGRGRLTSLVH